MAKVVAETMGIDMHNHVYPAGTQQGPQRGGDPGPPLSLAEELKLSGLTAICAGFALDRAKHFVPCSPDGYVIGDVILYALGENRFNLVGRAPALNWAVFPTRPLPFGFIAYSDP